MSRQLKIFLPKVQEAAGKISGAMGKFIEQQKAISMVDRAASKLQPVPPSSYTKTVPDGTVIVDADMKAYYEQIQDRLTNKVADDYSKFKCDWERFYATIMGQLCPATKEELRRSDGWETVAASLDPGALLRLI